MEKGYFESSLRGFQRRAPFRPFIVELISGTRLLVDHPETLVILRSGIAVHQNNEGELTLLDHNGVVALSDAPARASA